MESNRLEIEQTLTELEAAARCPAEVELVRALLVGGAEPATLILAGIHLGTAAAEARQASYQRDMERGRRVLQAAKQGHQAVHGTATQRQALYLRYQITVDEIHRKNPRLSWTELSNRAAKKHGCTGRSIRRHTSKPMKENGTLPGTVPPAGV